MAPMQRLGMIMALALAAYLLSRAEPSALAAGNQYPVTILVDGQPLAQYSGRGRHAPAYIEAQEGHEYQIQISNPTPYRVAAAVAVDGLNTIDAQHTSDANARKWVIDPWGSITINGWQVSQDRLRTFVFATEETSYGAKMGKTSDLGRITVAVFREKQAPAPAIVARASVSAKKASRPAEAAPALDLNSAGGAAARDLAQAPQAPHFAATAMGGSQHQDVTIVSLELERAPAERVTIRYEYRDALERLGIVPTADAVTYEQTLHRREQVTYSPEL